MRRPLFFVAVLFLAAGVVRGQDASAREEQEQIKALLTRVEKEVAELKAAQVAPAAPAGPPSAATTKPAPSAESPARGVAPMPEHPGQIPQEAMQQLETHYPSLQIRGFADANFSATDQKGTTTGFNLGQFDLHLASALSQKISYFAEITVNAHPQDYTIEMERSFIRYDYNDLFKISFGRFHTPIGYWNTAFHHGAWLETTIDRPFIVQVGGTFTPLHFVGALAEGNIPSGGLGLGYNVGIGNGRGSLIARPAMQATSTTSRLGREGVRQAREDLRPGSRRIGLSRQDQSSRRFRVPRMDLDQGRTGVSRRVRQRQPPQHRDERGANSDAMYAQFAYRLPGPRGGTGPMLDYPSRHLRKGI